MKKIINIFILVFSVSLFGLVSCEDPFAGDDFAAYTEQPMGIYLESIDEYDSWVKLLKKADLYNALNVDNDFTCFVANNAAVARYLVANKFSSIDVLTEDQAASIVSYHIVPFSVLPQEALGGQIIDKTKSGNYLLVEFDQTDPTAPKYLYGSQIINYNQTVINGVVHEIENVLEPPIYTVGELIKNSDRYTIFNEGVKLCGLEKYLNLKEVDVDYEKVKDYKTILVISDSIFEKNGIHNISDLRKRYTGDPIDPREPFYSFIAYHILPGSFDYNSLITKDEGVNGKNVETLASNQFITITDEGGLDNFINAQDDIEGAVMFDLDYSDIIANNGFLHEIDNLMNIVAPVNYPFAHELSTDREFEALDFYRGPNTKKTQDFMFNEIDSLEFIKITTIPSGKGVIRYTNDGNKVNMPMGSNDWLIVELGEMGSIEFTIPSIIPGRYNLIVDRWQYYWGVDNSISGGFPGAVQTYFNNNKVGAPQNHGDASTFGKQIVGEVQVVEKGANKLTFKITKAGPLGFDKIKFVPIK